MTERYECDKCGACCGGYLIVEAFGSDAMREPKIKHADLSRDYVPLGVLADPGKCVLLACGSPCKFLGDDKLCSIYETRPEVCRGMEAGSEQCQESRASKGIEPLRPITEDANEPTPTV